MKNAITVAIFWALAACLTLGAAQSSGAKPIRFEGAVTRDTAMTQEFGPGLVLKVASGQSGSFQISIYPKSTPDNDYAIVVTPPFNSPNALWISPWEVAPQTTSTIGRARPFGFTRNDAEFTRARAAVAEYTETHGVNGEEELDAVVEAAASGILCIDEAEGVLDRSPQATIRRLKFHGFLTLAKGEFPDCSGNISR